MVNLPPDPNLPPNPNDRQPSGRFRDNDELIAVVLAFLGIGVILFWGWTRGDQRNLLQTLPSVPLVDRALMTDEGTPDEAEIVEDDRFASPIPFFTSPNEIAEEDLEDRTATANRERRRGLGATAPRPAPQEVPRATTDAPSAVTPDAADAPVDEPTEPESEMPPLSIADVSTDYWAYPYIVSLYENGFLPDLPTGQLQPDEPLTRAEFAALLNSSFVGEAAQERSLTFTDISATFWAADAIEQVVDAGYMTGYPDDTFQPDQLVPRYQVLVTLATGLNLSPPANPAAVLDQFQGNEDVPNWAVEQVAAAIDNGLLVNYPEPQRLAPVQSATRAEIIVLLHQALRQQGRVEPVAESPYVDPGE
jgi:hypothetical protein